MFAIWSNLKRKWVAKPGYLFDYASNLANARTFETREEAEKYSIPEYEVVKEIK